MVENIIFNYHYIYEIYNVLIIQEKLMLCYIVSKRD